MLADISAMMSSELRRHCTHISFFKSYFRDVLPQLPIKPITSFKRNNTLNHYPIPFFDGTCHKTQSQTNRHPSIDRHSRRGQPLPPSIRLLITCAITPYLR